jgi:hypothetical protein
MKGPVLERSGAGLFCVLQTLKLLPIIENDTIRLSDNFVVEEDVV